MYTVITKSVDILRLRPVFHALFKTNLTVAYPRDFQRLTPVAVVLLHSTISRFTRRP